MRVVADKDRCIGSGMCALTAPDVFDQDPDEATVIVLDESPPEARREAVVQAVDRCPADVLRLAP